MRIFVTAEREEASWGVSQWGEGRRRRNEPCKPSANGTAGRRTGGSHYLQRYPCYLVYITLQSLGRRYTGQSACTMLRFSVCSPQRNLAKLTQEHKNLEELLKEEKSQKEKFRNTKNEIEEERRLLDRTVEKLQKEVRRKRLIINIIGFII